MSVGGKIVKRLFDILFSLVGIVFLVPLTVIIKIAYICTGDFHSIFLFQTRIKKNGKPFKCIKYRTMVLHADQEPLAQLLKDEKTRKEWDHKIQNDPRITRVGKIIRPMSIDETPQFINVLIGQMSAVGNRPYLPNEIDQLGLAKNTILSAKPGITGYWQTSGRSDVSFKHRIDLDYYYVKNQSIALDFKILFKTIGAVLTKDGAK